MVRSAFGAALALVLCAGVLLAADANKNEKNKKGQKATITKVDRQNGTVTVRMKGKDGKEHTRTFKLTGEVRYLDSTGRVAAADIFTSGQEVLVVEEQGRLKEIRQSKSGKTNKGAKESTSEKKSSK